MEFGPITVALLVGLVFGGMLTQMGGSLTGQGKSLETLRNADGSDGVGDAPKVLLTEHEKRGALRPFRGRPRTGALVTAMPYHTMPYHAMVWCPAAAALLSHASTISMRSRLALARSLGLSGGRHET